MLKHHVREMLQKLVGGQNYLDAPEDLICYSYDATLSEMRPEAVLLPESTAQVSEIMKIADRESIPVTARGAGTNLSGGSIPQNKGLVLAFTRMNRILEISKKDRLAVVQPGVVNGHLQVELSRQGLFYPPDPGSLNVSTLGGNVAENASGLKGAKYGVTRDYLLGLTVVLADGRIIKTGGRTVKNVTGMDLTSLFCGAEGALGIITEITLKLIPQPEAQRSIQASFADLDAAGHTVTQIISSGILPVALELMDSTTINLIEDYTRFGLPRDAAGLLLIMVDGATESLNRQVDRIKAICREQGAERIKVANSPEENDALWEARRNQFAVMTRSRPTCIVEDMTVPISDLPAMILAIRKIAEKYDLLIACTAHAGDGNLHPHFLTDKSDPEEWHRVKAAEAEIVNKAAELGGALSGEHGIGMAKTEYMDLFLHRDSRQIMGEIKKVLDPKDILNPGKWL
jgi:glycolate oxidase